MDSLLVSSSTNLSSVSLSYSSENSKYNLDALIVETSLTSTASNAAGFDFDLPKSLAISAQEILKKLNELLKDKLPNGIESLKPEDTTPEATATRIVQGATAFFAQYAKQNPELSEEELLDSFMEKIKGGIQSGYDDAYTTLEGLGAFEIEGVKSGIEQTKILIAQKLDSFYESKRKELGLSSTVKETAEITNTALLAQAGSVSLSVYA